MGLILVTFDRKSSKASSWVSLVFISAKEARICYKRLKSATHLGSIVKDTIWMIKNRVVIPQIISKTIEFTRGPSKLLKIVVQ